MAEASRLLQKASEDHHGDIARSRLVYTKTGDEIAFDAHLALERAVKRRPPPWTTRISLALCASVAICRARAQHDGVVFE